MATFASVWAVKSHRLLNEGETVSVRLKSGADKPVTVDKFLYSTESKDGTVNYFYLPAKEG